MHRRCSELRIGAPATMCSLFDSLVAPILSYACEVWTLAPGTTKPAAAAKTLHRRLLRRTGGIHHSALNAAVYAEFGRTPLATKWHHHATSYFTRLANLPTDRLAHKTLVEALSL